MSGQFYSPLKLLTVVLLTAFAAQPAQATETYVTDQGHSEIRFSWDRGISVQTAEFTEFEGILTLDPENIEQSSLDVVVEVNSLATGFKPLDDALLGASFFSGDQNPHISFKSARIEKTGANTADVIGDLTILGITKPVTLKAKLTHRGPHPYAAYVDIYSGNWVAFSATTTIDHLAFNVGSYSAGPISVTIVTEMKEREE